jgi:murein DD-endopeptidase MepM/ murein hydrolase activator NlpD
MTPEEKKSNLFEDEDLISPYVMPSNVSKAMAKYGDALDAIGNQLSKQNVILTRSLGNLRRIEQGLTDTEFLLGEIGENYQEALDDFKTEEKKKAARKKFVTKLISPFKKRETPQQATNQSPGKPKEDKPWWNLWDGSKQTQQKLASGGISSTGTGENNILQPGIYDNPTQGNLAPGTAVVPLNRNYGKDILGQYDQQQYEQALGKVLFKPTSALLGGAVSVYGSILRGLGPLAGYFNSSIPGILSTVSSILGISRSVVIDMFGGPAYAGVAPNEREERYFYKSWRIYMDKNRLYFEGAPGPFGGKQKETGEIAQDILVIGERGEGLMGMGGTNVDRPPAWIPFPKDASGKLFYISGFGKRWGRDHNGIDLAGNRGIKIISPFAGEVYDINRGAKEGDSKAGGGYGNLVGIKHERPPIFTFYGHLQDVAENLQVGSKVKAGEVIGTLGNTGFSTGPHLHWEVRTEEGGGQIDPVQWTHENKPSFQSGGWIKPMANLLSGITKPKGLSIRGVQAGFTGMAREGFNAIMSGDKFRLPAAKSLMGRGSQPVLGRGAYSAPTIKGAERYQKPGGGIVKTIVPSGARRVSIIEPQAVVKPSTFDKGKVLADKLLAGQYANSPLANKLRGQLLSGVAQNVGIGFAKTFGKAIGILNAPVISDMLFPEPTAAGTLDYARSQGWITPETSKPIIKTRTIELPSTPSVAPSQASAATPQFVNLDIPTNTVLTTTQMRRL